MTAKLPKISYPVPSNKNGHAFSSGEELLSMIGGESSGLYLVGSQGMWHGGIHITDATIPWCALSTDSEAENEYCRELYKGEQFIRCMADGEIVAWRVSKDYESAAIEWRGEKLLLSTSFVLVRHYIQPGDTEESGLTFFTLYMNLAPYAAYKQQGSLADRKVAGVQRYYSSAEDLQAGRTAGKLEKDTVVTLSDTIVTRSSDQRQFTEVTITRETKNAAGNTLAAGTKVWTVSDRGNLKATESVPVPSWWAKCTPAYTNESEGVVNCTSRTNWAYYLSSDDVLQYKNAGSLVADFPLSYEPGNTAQQVIRPGKNSGDAERTFSLVTLGRDKDKLKKGDRVWVVSDGDSLTSVAPAASGSEPVFDDVYVPSAPVPVNAGDSLGHMGFYQLPEENGKRSRYQVHIECLSMDDMEKFITNPGKAGEDAPVYLTWKADAPLFDKSDTGITAGGRKTKGPGILTLAKVPGVDAEGNTLSSNQDAAYYQIRPEGGWLAAASVQKVSQYALGELGFVTLNKASESFDLIDGIKQPNNVVKGILEQLYKAAEEETRTTHALNKYNYKRLLELIDSNQDGHYSEQEYLQAVHNVSYRDHLYRVIAKHASEWYYGKDDPLWNTYLDTLTTDAPLWKTYLEAFLDKMTWMKAVSEKDVALGPDPWHMHPVVFLAAMKAVNKQCYCYKQGIADRPCQSGAVDVTKDDFELLATQLGVEREVLRAIAVAETGDKVPFRYYVRDERHAAILYERHYMKRISLNLGVSTETVREVESSEPDIIHSYDSSYRHGRDSEQYQRLLRAREINFDAANMSCSWGKFQVMGEYYHHLYSSTQELVDAQNYCAMQHLQYFKIFLVNEKRMLQSMKDKDWLTIARKYNGTGQIGYDEIIENAYNSLKNEW